MHISAMRKQVNRALCDDVKKTAFFIHVRKLVRVLT